ncbi:MAG: fibronectin type III domain-containing protein, partial [Candidatus Rokuibacteriota bacterium]
ELAWTNPSRRVDGTRILALTVARIFRIEDTGAGEPRPAVLARGRIPGYREIATVRLDAPERAGHGNRVSIRDREGLTRGRRYTYVVVTEDAEGRASAPSPRVPVTFIAAPAVPRDLVGEPGEGQARLRWSPPASLVDGTPAPADLMYEVLRAAEPGAALTVVTPAPITSTTFLDQNLENERVYAYAVRAVRREMATTARGEATPRVVVMPVDMTAPSAPTALVAVPVPGAVQLSWRASPEADVGTYVIYRAPEGGAFARVGSVPAPDTTFVDRELSPGRYRYAVSAQDTGTRANESARSAEATVIVP